MSYNGLTVPLDYGTWCCELVPASDYEGTGGGRLPFLSAGERRQLEEDCRAFDLYFRPNYDFRRTITTDIDFDHVHNGLQPHAHNWTNGVRDGGDDVVPFSPWNP
ncbi:hypothetical protein A6V36_14835 [Paraburkholderia ginsengiterrae]|uniref:Uncharacterized protein n=1 Tax=Paraburkholderia ginsengiterrae TaxID=1462993 RepID=A0ABX2UJJ0_9BURK|nr:hypothetical protein [Paraburkholderia ginsengiterrae]OAJ51844.1 hypothetical protein A6V36_14835 [Paraburkholderia ginsengiterrae]